MPKLPCVTAILVNAQGQVLMHQRDDTPGLPFAGYWTMLGGKIESGEAPEAAMHRELLEEVGVDVPVRQWKVYDRCISDQLTVEQYVFVGEINHALADMVLTEGQDLNYFDAEHLADLPIAFGFDVLLREYFAEIAGSMQE